MKDGLDAFSLFMRVYLDTEACHHLLPSEKLEVIFLAQCRFNAVISDPRLAAIVARLCVVPEAPKKRK